MNAHDAAKILEAATVVWLTRQEAAKFARVSGDTIDRWRREGLKYSGGNRNGRKVLIRLDWLEDWLENRGGAS